MKLGDADGGGGRNGPRTNIRWEVPGAERVEEGQVETEFCRSKDPAAAAAAAPLVVGEAVSFRFFSASRDSDAGDSSSF